MQQIVRLRRCGFTLIELMVVVVVAGILAAVAYPSYTGYLQRSRRSDAMVMLTAVTQAQERYRTNRSAFSRSLTELLGANADRASKYYDAEITALDGDPEMSSGYKVTATPKTGSLQESDSACGTLAVEVQGASVNYFATGTESTRCWSR